MSAAADEPKAETAPYQPHGTIERKDQRLNSLIPVGANMERIASGFEWSEGPIWVPNAKALLFSDIPRNSVYQWSETGGLTLFLKPSGYTGSEPFTGPEPGSNGLTLDANGALVLCQHGDRRVSRLAADGKGFDVLAEKYDGKRLNSPNDLIYHSNGDLYFTDPPYGLPKNIDDPNKEIDFQGVYRLSKDGKLTLLTRDMSRPNGLGFSPDEKTLYVANSDPDHAVWMSFPVKDDGTLGEGKVFFDATPLAKTQKGLPDGLSVDQSGNIFATGPGGVLVFAPDGTHLGTLLTGEATANCAFGGEGASTLYITADMYILRVPTQTHGLPR